VRREAAMYCATGNRNSRSSSRSSAAANRRYYQRQDVIVIRQIRSLLYEQGFTIGGAARNKLGGDEARHRCQPKASRSCARCGSKLEEVLRILRR